MEIDDFSLAVVFRNKASFNIKVLLWTGFSNDTNVFLSVFLTMKILVLFSNKLLYFFDHAYYLFSWFLLGHLTFWIWGDIKNALCAKWIFDKKCRKCMLKNQKIIDREAVQNWIFWVCMTPCGWKITLWRFLGRCVRGDHLYKFFGKNVRKVNIFWDLGRDEEYH